MPCPGAPSGTAVTFLLKSRPRKQWFQSRRGHGLGPERCVLLVSSGQEGPIRQSRRSRLILTSTAHLQAAGVCSSAGFPEPEMASSAHVCASHGPCPRLLPQPTRVPAVGFVVSE